MHPAQLRCSSVEWPAIRPSRALLDGRLVTRVGVFINLRRLIDQPAIMSQSGKVAGKATTGAMIGKKYRVQAELVLYPCYLCFCLH